MEPALGVPIGVRVKVRVRGRVRVESPVQWNPHLEYLLG